MQNDTVSENVVLFEWQQRNLLWRVQRVHWRGEDRLSIWPHFERDGEWFPCATRFGGGLNIPGEAVPELVAVLSLAFGKGGNRDAA